MSTQHIDENAVTNQAYLLWQTAGRPQGRDLEFWLQAEAQVYSGGGSEKLPLQKPARSSATKLARHGKNEPAATE